MRMQRPLLLASIMVLLALGLAVPLPTEKRDPPGTGETGGQQSASEGEGGQTPCGSCYGAADPQKGISCCDSCDDVRSAYKTKGWAWPGEAAILRAAALRECLHCPLPDASLLQCPVKRRCRNTFSREAGCTRSAIASICAPALAGPGRRD